MIIIDGIIYSLQRHGGISVYFNEIIRRISQERLPHKLALFEGASFNINGSSCCIEERSSRLCERYRDMQVHSGASLFHSSYYRLPDRALPVVTTVHDFTYERYVKGARRWIHSAQKMRAIKNSQAIICISENTRRDLLMYCPKIDISRVHVIYNGVGEHFFPLPKGAAKSPAARPFVLFVGARSGYKNFHSLVLALSDLPDFDLYCVGGGALSAEELELVKRLLPDRCRHLGVVSDIELNALYNNAFCLVYPSLYEGFGIPVLEAMRAGCPVIAARSSSIPEVAGKAALLVDSPTRDELYHAILSLQESQIRDRLVADAFIQAGKFSWQKTFEETVNVYESVSDIKLRI